MLWMDAHGDFNSPQTTPSGFVGGMCLVLACGRGPPLSRETEEGRGPLLAEEAVVHLGSRALDRLEERAMKESEIALISAKELRKGGDADCGRRAAKLLSDRCDWCVLHIDLDVIDPREMPRRQLLGTERHLHRRCSPRGEELEGDGEAEGDCIRILLPSDRYQPGLRKKGSETDFSSLRTT